MPRKAKPLRIGRQSAAQEMLTSIVFASPRIGYVQSNEDGTHAKACCCRWCVLRRGNEHLMSIGDNHKILRAVGEIREALEGASMEYQNALAVNDGLRAIEAIAARVEDEHAAEIKVQTDIIEGLLANWPHTEIVQHYTPSEQPVLMKEEALKRASILLKSR